MSSNNNYQEQFYKRIKERHLWARSGWILLIVSFAIFIVLVISFFLGVPFDLFYILLNISLLGIFLGSIFTLLLSRLGWSKSKSIDFTLNRLSILLILGGIMAMVLSSTFYAKFPHWMSYGQGVALIGVILVLLGIRFQSSIEE
jgi:hypothetical protein